jgi:glycosyltransferase involved in cell wall biosynthesis
VLVSAFACNPHQGSEEGVGWGWIGAISQHHRVTVVTAAFNEEPLRAWAEEHAGELGDTRFVYVPHRRWHYEPTRRWRKIEDSPLKPIMNLAYASWLRDGARVAERVLREDPYELLHLITYVGYRFPGTYYELPVPFVWGPIGGLDNTPWPFLGALGPVGAAYHAARNVINAVQRRVLPGPRRALRRAAPHGVIAATGGIQRQLLRAYGAPSRVISEIGLPPLVATTPARRAPGEPLRIAWSGEHKAGKALPILLEALARLPRDLPWRLTVLGVGPLTSAWQKRAQRFGLADRLDWTGWIPRDEALRAMKRQHVLVITSMMDLTSTVLLEGVSLGLAVIAPDHCGFGDVLAPDRGVLLSVRHPAQFVGDLSRALTRLERDEPERHRLAEAGLGALEAFSWQHKSEQIRRIYEAVLEEPRRRLVRSALAGAAS